MIIPFTYAIAKNEGITFIPGNRIKYEVSQSVQDIQNILGFDRADFGLKSYYLAKASHQQ